MWPSKIRLKNKREIKKGKSWWRKVNQTLKKEKKKKKKIGKGKGNLFEEVSFGGLCVYLILTRVPRESLSVGGSDLCYCVRMTVASFER